LLAGNVQFHAQHQANTADLLDTRVLAGQLVEFQVEVAAHALDGGHQFVQNVAEFQGHAAGQRATTESGPVHARLDGVRGLLVGHDDAQRDAAGQRLGRHHDVGQDDVVG